MITAASTESISSSGVDLHGSMEAYVDGDDRAFARLYAALAPRVRSRLTRLVRNPAIVDDLVQLTFLRAHAARDRFEAMPDRADRAVEAWYLAIARNVALDHMRQSYRRERRQDVLVARGELAGLGAPEAPLNAEDLAVVREQRDEVGRLVRDAIDELPPSQREVVALHKLRGMSMAEIGDRLGVRPGALRVRAHRAYKSLADTLRRLRPEAAAA